MIKIKKKALNNAQHTIVISIITGYFAITKVFNCVFIMEKIPMNLINTVGLQIAKDSSNRKLGQKIFFPINCYWKKKREKKREGRKEGVREVRRNQHLLTELFLI